MNMKKPMVLLAVAAFVIQLTACGTIIHPERKGQSAGQLDPSIVVLNAVGLLFFLVPGVVAFAVDFNNGSIYLPGGSASINSRDVNVVTVDGDITKEKIEQVILEQTGESINMDDSVILSEKMAYSTGNYHHVHFL